jgi:uncharacterized protein YbjT (DUF2867 family)
MMVLVTGATGYVGGRLVPQLVDAGYRVRVLARDPERLKDRSWHARVEIAQGDVLQAETLTNAMQGVDAAYYLVHSMSELRDFRNRDLTAARNFGRAARAANVQRIIYLGGLGNPDEKLSKHLRSRQETGDALRESGVPVTEFRAAIIVGSGSVSFEIIRTMTERVPLMICPRWVYVRVQPIAIRDILDYLVTALRVPESAGRIIEIGGADVQKYGDMMLGYARARFETLVDSCAGVDAQTFRVLGSLDDADSREYRASVDRRIAERSDCARWRGAPDFSEYSAARLRTRVGRCARATQHESGRNVVERRAA